MMNNFHVLLMLCYRLDQPRFISSNCLPCWPIRSCVQSRAEHSSTPHIAYTSRYQCSQVFITLSDGLGVNNMRCTNRRSSRTLKTAVLMVCLALVMLLLLCSGCRFFHTKKEVSQLSRRTNLIQKYRAREKKKKTEEKEQRTS